MKKKPRKQTRRERALSCAVREVLRAYSDFYTCPDCLRDDGHDEACLTTTLRRALRVKP
jgi:hypothetical protein